MILFVRASDTDPSLFVGRQLGEFAFQGSHRPQNGGLCSGPPLHSIPGRLLQLPVTSKAPLSKSAFVYICVTAAFAILEARNIPRGFQEFDHNKKCSQTPVRSEVWTMLNGSSVCSM